MAEPRDVDYLQPDEQAASEARRHPLSAVDAFLALGLLFVVVEVALGVLLIGFAGAPVAAAVLMPLAALLFAGWAIVVHWRRATSLYVVTPERVYKAYGRIRFHLLQTTYDKVTDLHLHQSIFGRMWGYGTVRLQTAGTGLSLNGVRDPVAFKQRIESHREAFLHALVSEAGGRASRRPQAASADGAAPMITPPDAPTTTLVTTSPARASFVVGAVGGAIAVLIGLVVVTAGALWAPGAITIGAIATVVGGLVIFGQFLQFKYTHYDITTRGVVVRKGWLSRRRVETTFSKVTDVSVDQDIVARLFGYGKITINTAGSNEAPIVFAGVAFPDRLKDAIDAARRQARA